MLSAESLDGLVKADRVHRRLYIDPAIFETEMQRIFERTWVFVGHESEVPHPGDYKTTYIGRTPVIMSRDSDGGIHVLMNRCMHRGAVVCREERGNSTAFRCSYHGWTYNNRGELVVVTGRGGYGPEFDPRDCGLIRAPRIDAYRGFVFASLSREGESLDEYLGKAKEYLDLAIEESPESALEVRSGVQRYAFPANWKFQIENWTDHYHAQVVHESAFGILSRRRGRPELDPSARDSGGWEDGRWHGVTHLGHGHNTERTRSSASTTGFTTPGRTGLTHEPGYVERMAQRYGLERARDLVDADIQLVIFPNFFIQLRRHHFRVLRPVAVDRTEVYAYPYTLKGAPDEVNQRMVPDVAWWASAAGFGQPDDLEQFVRCQAGLQAVGADWVLFMRGVGHEEVLPDGEIRGVGEYSEVTHRGIYREWKRLMSRSDE